MPCSFSTVCSCCCNCSDYSRCSCYGGWLRHSRTDAEMESTSSDSLPSSEYSDEQCLREGATGGTQVSDYPTYKANDDLNSAFDATLWGSKKCLSHHVTDNWNKVFCSCGTAECTCGQFSRDLPPGDWFRRMFYPRWSCFWCQSIRMINYVWFLLSCMITRCHGLVVCYC